MKKACCLFLLLFLPLRAQESESLEFLWRQAKGDVIQGKYLSALERYEEAVERVGFVPTEFCYYLAKALYKMHEITVADRVLSAYFLHTPEEDSLYLRASLLREEIKMGIDEIRNCKLCDSEGFRYIKHKDCGSMGYRLRPCLECDQSGELLCTACQGQGIWIRQNRLFQFVYQICPGCRGSLKQKCSACGGKTHTLIFCAECGGNGYLLTDHVCSHKEKITKQGIEN
ncbi:MAG: hypothetical protein OXB93_02435 [Cytophagales bacterium]|nr:hypothetical protein [Cytophagales bacterium]